MVAPSLMRRDDKDRPMADEAKRCLRIFYRAFSSPINTLLAQTLIASLLLAIGIITYAQIEAGNINREMTVTTAAVSE